MKNKLFPWRIGWGFDVHTFTARRKNLILGGAVIPCSFGIDAVSDGDLVLHAVADAVCGACALGDIGDYFPPAAAQSKGIASTKIVNFILQKIKKHYTIVNIDITIIAQKPKLVSHKPRILDSLKSIFKGSVVNVKIKSKEGLNILGGTNAIACTAAVFVMKK